MPRVGSSKDQDIAVPQQPFGNDDLLLIAAGQQTHLLRVRRRSNAQFGLIKLFAVVADFAITFRAPPAPVNLSIDASTMLSRTFIPVAKPKVLAIFGQVSDPGSHRIFR